MFDRAHVIKGRYATCIAAVLAFLSPWLLPVAPEAQGGQKPVVTHDIAPGRGRGYASVQDMWNGSALVVEGTIAAETPVDEDQGATVITLYDVNVTEVFKREGDQQPPTAVKIRQAGGRRETEARLDVYRDPRFPPFELGQHCILFLAHAGAGQYWTLAGTEGVFIVGNSDNVQTPARNEAGRGLARGGLMQLRDTLRQLARRRP